MQSTKHWPSLSIPCLVCLLGIALLTVPTQGQTFAYVTNSSSSSVSVIDTATNTVTATIGGGEQAHWRRFHSERISCLRGEFRV